MDSPIKNLALSYGAKIFYVTVIAFSIITWTRMNQSTDPTSNIILQIILICLTILTLYQLYRILRYGKLYSLPGHSVNSIGKLTPKSSGFYFDVSLRIIIAILALVSTIRTF